MYVEEKSKTLVNLLLISSLGSKLKTESDISVFICDTISSVSLPFGSSIKISDKYGMSC